MFFSLSGQTQQYRHANDKRCSNLPQQECHAVQKLLISVKQHCHAIHQKKQNEIRQHSFFPFQITAAVTDYFCSQISTVKNHAVQHCIQRKEPDAEHKSIRPFQKSPGNLHPAHHRDRRKFHLSQCLRTKQPDQDQIQHSKYSAGKPDRFFRRADMFFVIRHVFFQKKYD